MSVLTDTDIRKMLETDISVKKSDTKIVIAPFSESSLTPVGYDLRVGTFYKSSEDEFATDLSNDEKAILAPGSTTNIRTLEWIGMPQEKMYSGLICSKVSKVAMGLSHVSTTIDPDWAGELSISIHNHSDKVIELKVGEAFCTAIFLRNESAATKSCGFGPSRTDTLVASLTTEQKAKDRKKTARKKWLIGVLIILTLCMVFVAIYKLYIDNVNDNSTRAAIAASTMVFGTFITSVLTNWFVRILGK
jgi:deoxycytidine triphosphate deaminase